jgi:hypothetical protein
MQCPELTKPRIKAEEIKKIILGGGFKGIKNENIDKNELFLELVHNEF